MSDNILYILIFTEGKKEAERISRHHIMPMFMNRIQKIEHSLCSSDISIVKTMADSQTKDIDFDMSESMSDPFKGTLRFAVQRNMEIKNFEFSTHDMGCRRINGRRIKYGLKLTLNGKKIFSYHNHKVDVQVQDKLILTPGNTYQLETWVGGHVKLKSGQNVNSCEYHYAQINRFDKTDRTPFIFIFPDDEDENKEPSNKTCLYIIEYKIVD